MEEAARKPHPLLTECIEYLESKLNTFGLFLKLAYICKKEYKIELDFGENWMVRQPERKIVVLIQFLKGKCVFFGCRIFFKFGWCEKGGSGWCRGEFGAHLEYLFFLNWDLMEHMFENVVELTCSMFFLF